VAQQGRQRLSAAVNALTEMPEGGDSAITK
jgi:hypothetical protein